MQVPTTNHEDVAQLQDMLCYADSDARRVHVGEDGHLYYSVYRPKVDADGAPVLHDDGEPVLVRHDYCVHLHKVVR